MPILLRLALLFVVATATLPSAAQAQGYIEKKDDDAVGVIERALAKIAEQPALFDGRAIPPGAELRQVGELARRLGEQLGVAKKHHDELSAAGQARPAVQALMQRWQTLAAYHRALVPIYNAAAAAADAESARRATSEAADRAAGIAACTAFRQELLADPTERERLDRLAQIADGVDTHWQDVESGAKHQATMAKAAALCARPAHADIGRACAYMSHSREQPEARWCAAAAKGNEVIKQAARNLAGFHAKHFGPNRSADNLAAHDGWVDIEGPVTWAEYFSGQKDRAVLMKRLAPVFEQAGLTSIDDLEVFRKLDAHYTALAAKVTELASTWDLPGAACGGPACGAAKKTAAAWYPGAKLRRVLEDQRGWKVVQNALGIPTHRYKGGYVLLQVKGDPLCQLRSWTVTENHKGGGRYQAASGAQIGYVRWQACR